MRRERVLIATAELVDLHGVGPLTVSGIIGRAGVSRKTFYQHFHGREQVLSAAIDESLARAAAAVLPAYREQSDWREAMRAGLAALLCFLDEQPAYGRLLVVGVLSGGPPLLRRRARVLDRLIDAVDEGRALALSGQALTRSAAEAVVGAVLSMLHTRMIARKRIAMSGLHGELMTVIVRPYLGAAAARREAERTLPDAGPGALGRRRRGGLPRMPSIRLTRRTAMVLNAIAEHPAISNREVAMFAGINDQGQTSKLLRRLASAGVIANDPAAASRMGANAWVLTATGRELAREISVHSRSLC